MSLRINTNIDALDAAHNLASTQNAISKSMQRLSTGKRINSAADDAAGLTISEKMQGQISGMQQAQANIQDGQSLVQTAEGNLDEVHSMLQRVRELAVQYKNGTLSAIDQAAIQTEVNQLGSEIERLGQTAQFNGISLLAAAGSVTFQVGANDGETITAATISMGSTVGSAFLSLGATDALSQIDAAIDAISAERSTFGAVSNRLDHALNAAATYQENLTAANSRIEDVDMASETVNLTNQQILSQAGMAMLAQANQQPQSVLKLLQ
jgi:flagellin